MKRFERSNGLDTALYKNYLFTFLSETREMLPHNGRILGVRWHQLGHDAFSVDGMFTQDVEPASALRLPISSRHDHVRSVESHPSGCCQHE